MKLSKWNCPIRKGIFNMKTVLVSGGVGYIGSHTCVELIQAGYSVVVADDLRNSKLEALNRVEKITGVKPIYYNEDVCDEGAMEAIFAKHKIDVIIHFAGYKAVGESVAEPIKYYRNNLNSTMVLLDCMKKYGVKSIIFSSSATVYGVPTKVPIPEEESLKPVNPYGRTKYMSELIIEDFVAANPDKSAVLLRYFNPVGAHPSGILGEDTPDTPNNLMPYIQKVVAGKFPHLRVFGNDYDTHDGTGVRDYIHVVDLAKGHLAAIEYSLANSGVNAVNLGTGTGYSVLDLVHAFENANGVEVPYVITERRPGDVASCYSDPKKAKKVLNWQAKCNVEDMCRSVYNWTMKNPNGYDD